MNQTQQPAPAMSPEWAQLNEKLDKIITLLEDLLDAELEEDD